MLYHSLLLFSLVRWRVVGMYRYIYIYTFYGLSAKNTCLSLMLSRVIVICSPSTITLDISIYTSYVLHIYIYICKYVTYYIIGEREWMCGQRKEIRLGVWVMIVIRKEKQFAVGSGRDACRVYPTSVDV